MQEAKSNVTVDVEETLELVSKREYNHLINTNRKQSDLILQQENIIEKLKADNQVLKGKLIKVKELLE